MGSQQRSFHLIECPAGVSSSHARLVVNGRGVPHASLTVFYEELQKTNCFPAREVAMQSVLSFFSFLEQPDLGVETAASPHETCSSRPCALKRNELPPATYWAGTPSEIKVAIRAYLLARWGCLTRSSSPDEEMVLSPSAKAKGEIRRFLAVLQQFYRFAIERQDYWYDGNPVTAFHIPLLSLIWQVIAPSSFTLRSRPALHQSRRDEGLREELVQSISPFSPRLEQPSRLSLTKHGASRSLST